MTTPATDNRGHRLHHAGALTERHMNREVTADGVTGTLVGLLPVGDDVILALLIGGSRAWKTVPANEPVNVAAKGAAR